MSDPVNRRQWLISTGVATGSSLLMPSVLPALRTARSLDRAGSYQDRLLEMEASATEARRAAGPVRLCYNENPFGMSPKAKDGIMSGWFEHSQYDLQSNDGLKRAFARHAGVDPSNVLITQGSSETLSIAALAFSLHGTEVLAPWPTFELIATYSESIGATVRKVPLTADLGHDFAAMDAQLTNAVRLVFVCNPNNPTSTVSDSEQMRSFVSSAQRRALVIVDEAYHEFVDVPGHRSLTDLVLKGENVLISRTASKIHGLAGLRIGFAIARPDIVERLEKLMTGNPNAFGMQAAIASIADTAYQDFVKGRNRDGRALLTTTLQAMGKRVAPSHTNFVFFQAGMPNVRFAAAMREKGFIVGRPFPPYMDWCRVSIGTPDEMKAFVAALPAALKV